MDSKIFEKSLTKDFNKELWSVFLKAVKDYRLVTEGDKIAVCISGGKDSMLLALCMKIWQKYSPYKFDVEYICVNSGYSAENLRKIKENADLFGTDIKILEAKIFESVRNSNKNPCFVCSRLRRGFLYKKAMENGCNKIALGHHFDDAVETTLMGMLYGSQIQAMLPRIKSDNYADMELIRPLWLVREENIIKFCNENSLSFTKCECSVTDGSGRISKREEIRNLLEYMRKTNPEVDKRIFKSCQNVNLKHLVSYYRGEENHSFLDEFN
ncbi:MAG: tRNA 2-thiocytidine biosynthesis protein TtcA [Ruminococcus sp.]|nr:tRNA 2-thiocytidine biosynthesis protein TtcA [Ruminococcus sp.]